MDERLTAALHVVGLIPIRNKYWYGLRIVVLGLAVCVCEIIMYINEPTIQEKSILPIVGKRYFFKKKGQKKKIL